MEYETAQTIGLSVAAIVAMLISWRSGEGKDIAFFILACGCAMGAA